MSSTENGTTRLSHKVTMSRLFIHNPLVLPRQQDGVVGEVEGDALRREIGVFNRLAEDHVAVAVVAGQHRSLIGVHRELPDLKVFGCNTRVMLLNDRDL